MSIKVTQKIEEIVLPIIKELNLELFNIEYKREGNNWFLRIFIDKSDGEVDIDDCGKVSENLSIQLDKVDPIPNAYFLEVSSPGAERPLRNEKDILNSINKKIHITTTELINNQKIFEGILENFENNTLTVKCDKLKVEISYDLIASIRLAVVF
ncbi:MAG: ribosome maturation factor RimP [Vulcanibacillus sp.]